METAATDRVAPGGYHRPIDFNKFAALARGAANDRRWKPVPWQLSPAVGGVSVTLPDRDTNDPGQLFAAWALSNTPGITSRFYYGCGPVVFDGWPVVGRQTEYFDVVTAVEESLDEWAALAVHTPARVGRLRSTDLPQSTARELLFDAGRREWVASSRVFDAYEAFVASPGTAWDLLVAFGAVAARGPAHRRLPAMYQFYRATTRQIA